MPKPKYHVLVCVNRRPPGHPKGSCGDSGGQDILEEFQIQRDRKDLYGLMRLTQTGCMGPCQFGPTVVVYPDDVWYGKVAVRDVEEIIESHLLNGKPVERLKLEENIWG